MIRFRSDMINRKPFFINKGKSLSIPSEPSNYTESYLLDDLDRMDGKKPNFKKYGFNKRSTPADSRDNILRRILKMEERKRGEQVDGIPKMPVFRDHRGFATGMCPRCGMVGSYGRGDGHRGSHCINEDRAGTVELITVPGMLPAEARQINDKVDHYEAIILDRRMRGGLDAKKWKVKSSVYLEKIESLIQRVRDMNEQILKESNINYLGGIEMRDFSFQGIRVCPEMSRAEAERIIMGMSHDDIESLDGDTAILLLVKQNGGRCMVDDSQKLQFSMPEPPQLSPEEQWRQDQETAARCARLLFTEHPAKYAEAVSEGLIGGVAAGGVR